MRGTIKTLFLYHRNSYEKFQVSCGYGWLETKKNVLNQQIMEDSNGLTKSATVCGLYKKEILIFF